MARVLRANQRRGRRALLWAGGVFALVQLAAGLLLDSYGPELRFPEAAARLARLQAARRLPDIVCLGSSRLQDGFYAAEVQRRLQELTGDASLQVFNAALPAGDPITAEFMMEHLLRQGVRPAIVLIEVSPETLARRNLWLGQHLLRQLTWQDLPTYGADIWHSRCLDDLLWSRALPLYVHRRQICRTSYQALRQAWRAWFTNPSTAGDSRAGHVSAPLALASNVAVAKRSPEATIRGVRSIRQRLQDYHLGGTATAALERLLERCRHHNIKVILVGVPVTSPHRNLYTTGIESAFLRYMDRLTQTYQCQFVDYRDRIPDGYFRDNHHLVLEGAMRFSRQLARDVLAPAWMAGAKKFPSRRLERRLGRRI